MLGTRRLVCEDGDALVLLDLPAVRRLLLFLRLLQAPDAPLPTRRLLVPSLLDLEPADARALEDRADVLLPFGLEVSAFGPDVVALHALAPELDGTRGRELLTAAREALRDGPREGAARTREVARAVSAFADPGPGRPDPSDLEALVGRLLAVPLPYPPDLPNPRVRVEPGELDRWFKRGRA